MSVSWHKPTSEWILTAWLTQSPFSLSVKPRCSKNSRVQLATRNTLIVAQYCSKWLPREQHKQPLTPSTGRFSSNRLPHWPCEKQTSKKLKRPRNCWLSERDRNFFFSWKWEDFLSVWTQRSFQTHRTGIHSVTGGKSHNSHGRVLSSIHSSDRLHALML